MSRTVTERMPDPPDKRRHDALFAAHHDAVWRYAVRRVGEAGAEDVAERWPVGRAAQRPRLQERGRDDDRRRDGLRPDARPGATTDVETYEVLADTPANEALLR